MGINSGRVCAYGSNDISIGTLVWQYLQGKGHGVNVIIMKRIMIGITWNMVRRSKDKVLWKWIDGSCYAFDDNGMMYCYCITLDGWVFDESGVWDK